ncbi:MAG: helix-turn-helix transcriptional regulator [Eubacteriales bacterium]|nr:helix-turn-helix transcriptional regulator [Eubacteriales bacterium]
MFDAVEIGRRISRLRKEKDMTQPALADVMGVSFQAVSNWERGASMPDIGKLPELAQALGVSVDELLGGGRGGELIRSVIDGKEESFVKNERITLSEAGEAAPLLKPKQVTRIVKAIEEEKQQRQNDAAGEDRASAEQEKIDFGSLISIAPFLDEDYLDTLATRLAPDVGLARLAALAPFVSEETLGKLAQNSIRNGGTLGELAAIAPFLDEEDLGKIALDVVQKGGTLGELAALAPFLDEDDLGKIALSCVESGSSISQVAAVAPFLDEEDLDRIVKTALKHGQKAGDLTALFPFLSQEALRALIEDALKRNDTGSLSNISKFL